VPVTDVEQRLVVRKRVTAQELNQFECRWDSAHKEASAGRQAGPADALKEMPLGALTRSFPIGRG